jgi:hypothetical protein
MMTLIKYNQMNMEELRLFAEKNKIPGRSRLRRKNLVSLIESWAEENGEKIIDIEESTAIDNINESADYSDFPEDFPEEIESEYTSEKKVSIPKIKKTNNPFLGHIWYQLENNVTFYKNGGSCTLIAGRKLSDKMYNINEIRQAGGILTLIQEGEK